ncbi:family A G protein-coupled receptor-like protein [Jaminaea rosea]|uniref:Family A G protein-coupled receptor-like protein n=1 Tax=Jaminaea rosea TaxID=1569628 RepID=A0A316V3M8_9BASI|nr:family A G protein-coupled receptor-like protein [Jaminaea rosea]PWN30803.1 family A G protein-coupled receptor-like protein [Jaminaea rosea]
MNQYFENFAYELTKPSKHHDGPITIPEPVDPDLHHPEKITKMGKTVLWVVAGIMTLGFITFVAHSQRIAYRFRTIPVITAMINVTAAISYLAMATGLGGALTNERHDSRYSAKREVLVPRYIDWLITTPLLILDITLLAGMPLGEILIAIFADVTMIITGLIAGLHPDVRARWIFFAISVASMFYVFYTLVGSGRSYSYLRSQKVGSLYNQVSLALLVVWSLYAVTFVLGEGAGYVSADTEVLLFAVLDVIAKPLWGAVVVFAVPEEGHVLLPESLASPLGGGYTALSQGDERREDA